MARVSSLLKIWKFPRSFTVLGLEMSVRRRKKIVASDGDVVDGYFEPDHNRISVSTDATLTDQIHSFWHEAFHAAFFRAGLAADPNFKALEETICQAAATAVIEVMPSCIRSK